MTRSKIELLSMSNVDGGKVSFIINEQKVYTYEVDSANFPKVRRLMSRNLTKQAFNMCKKIDKLYDTIKPNGNTGRQVPVLEMRAA